MAGQRQSRDFSVEELRRRARRSLGSDLVTRPDSGGDRDLNPDWPDATHSGARRRASAVLIPVIARPGGAWIVMTRRADHLPEHAGQIAFPGGKIGAGDASPLDAALREANEEIGLGAEHVEVIGRLDDYETATGFEIAPFIGILRAGFTLDPDPGEVAEILKAPLEFLMTPANHQVRRVIWRGKTRRFHAMPYRNHYIWGATAGILHCMYERLYSE